ncbi:hypothetical protein [Streptosporangium roseum]|uniref:Uncharacterized protein n=1 Tax=Streptosporangium roseum (strain ATCC 12428 / DSM 43021 / JCM 3005 / KCTC 9067 / NCIMB 10171 / NRRL 2505 / NI 9100) TaxID=479432 RepID=D2B620_STRRD|nr:hypothetical protein [Streptosporangium roseum]ACZ83733.1 hypothetical protein Sros_0710 [Streptosporangium roseum DSM 43021]
MRIRSILSVTALVGSLALLCQPAHAAFSELRQDAVVVTDIVDYQCTVTGVVEKQDIKVKVELTMPVNAVTGQQMTISWHGTYVDGTALRAPAAGLASGTKLYAYASISGLPGLTSATGVGELATLSAGQTVPLPMTMVPLKTKSSKAGTATVKPAAINFGTKTDEKSIECEVQNTTALTTYPLTVASANDQPTDPAPVTPSPQPTPTVTATADDQSTGSVPVTSDPQPTHTVTATVTKASTDGNSKVIKTPSGGAATGGGGESGPDGRMLISTGFLLTFAAVTGLLLRRRSLPRG